ncbi:hypothetical protein KDL45_11905 [bacterium]|nr:hypothetical protein [bacterium]MCB9478521.1 hypothetical protein [Deltaproteobacteria bacterium]
MPTCEVTGKSAELIASKRFHLIPTRDRYYTKAAYAKVRRNEDIILSFLLLLALAAVTATGYLSFEEQAEQTRQVKAAEQKALMASDFNGDGVLDLWESQATPTMAQAFRQTGYPWEDTSGKDEPTRAVLATIPVAKWKEIFETNDNVRNAFNFPTVMELSLEKKTDPNNNVQIDRVFLTMDGAIGFIIKTYEQPPSQWPPTPTPAKARGGTPVPTPQHPYSDLVVGYENLTRADLQLLATVFGVKPEYWPPAYGEPPAG